MRKTSWTLTGADLCLYVKMVFVNRKGTHFHLVRVGDIRTAVTGISHFVSVSIFLVNVGNLLAVVQVVGNS